MPETVPSDQPQPQLSQGVAHLEHDERTLGAVASENPRDALQGEVIQETREIRRLLRKQFTLIRSRIHIGPLPPAEDFRDYEAAHPGAAGRILKMAESEQAHGQKMDREVLASDKEIAGRGQYYAMLATALLGVLGAALGFTGHDLLGGTFVVSSLVPIVAHFLGGRGGEARSKPAADPPRSGKAIQNPASEQEEHDPPVASTGTE